MPKYIKLNNDFREDVLDLVTSPKFGSYQKSDLNLLLFHYAMVREVSDKPKYKGIDDQLKYYLLDRQDQAQLAGTLNLPIGRIKSLIEQSASIYGREPDHEEFAALLRPLVQQARPAERWYRDGTVAVLIHNKAMKELLVTKLDAVDGFVDYSFNRDIMRVPAFNLLVLIGRDDTRTVKAFLKQLKASGKLSDAQKAKLDSEAISEINRSQLRDAVSTAASIAGSVTQIAIGSLL